MNSSADLKQLFVNQSSISEAWSPLFKMDRNEMIRSFFDFDDPNSVFNILRSLGVRFKDNSEELGQEFLEKYKGYLEANSDEDSDVYVNVMTVEVENKQIVVSIPAQLPNYLPTSVCEIEITESDHPLWNMQYSLYLAVIEELIHVLQFKSGSMVSTTCRTLMNHAITKGVPINIIREHDVFFYILEQMGYDTDLPIKILGAIGERRSKLSKTSWMWDHFSVYGNPIEFLEEMMTSYLIDPFTKSLRNASTLEEWRVINSTYLDGIRPEWYSAEFERYLLERFRELGGLEEYRVQEEY